MKPIVLVTVSALALAACSEPPPPKPAAQAQPQAAAPKIESPAPTPVAQVPEPPKPDPDKELASRVRQALESAQAKLPSGAIDVTASDGKVSLWGTVASEAQRRRATALAGKVEGVKGVDNQLKIVRGS
jgi:hypothetical protein